MKLHQYFMKAISEFEANPDWRMGQAYFNVLDENKPHLAAKVINTHLDPYYNDSAIPEFLEFIGPMWETADEIGDW